MIIIIILMMMIIIIINNSRHALHTNPPRQFGYLGEGKVPENFEEYSRQ